MLRLSRLVFPLFFAAVPAAAQRAVPPARAAQIQAFLASPAGAALISLQPALGQARSLKADAPRDMAALYPLAQRLPAAFADLPPGAQAEVFSRAYEAAQAEAPAALDTMVEFAALRTRGDGRILENVLAQAAPYAMYGESSWKRIDALRAAGAAIKAGKSADELAAALLSTVKRGDVGFAAFVADAAVAAGRGSSERPHSRLRRASAGGVRIPAAGPSLASLGSLPSLAPQLPLSRSVAPELLKPAPSRRSSGLGAAGTAGFLGLMAAALGALVEPNVGLAILGILGMGGLAYWLMKRPEHVAAGPAGRASGVGAAGGRRV